LGVRAGEEVDRRREMEVWRRGGLLDWMGWGEWAAGPTWKLTGTLSHRFGERLAWGVVGGVGGSLGKGS
jgi:hypothetical protein